MYSLAPFKNIFDLAETFPDNETCIKYLEKIRWKKFDDTIMPISPFDNTSIVYKCKNNRYKCKNTGKYFNVLSNTVMENTKIPLKKWFMAIFLFTSHKKGISSHQLAKDITCTQKSSWFLLSRIRHAFESQEFISEMSGIIEVDETFIGGKNANRHWDKKVPKSQGRSFKDKTPVLGIINEEGQIKCTVVKDTAGKTIQPIILSSVARGSLLVSDEWGGYNGLNKAYFHSVVDHKHKQYVNHHGHTTNHVECAWSHFDRTILGTYHSVSKQHLQKYASEFSFRYSTKKQTTQERFDLSLSLFSGKRITYKNLIAKCITKA